MQESRGFCGNERDREKSGEGGGEAEHRTSRFSDHAIITRAPAWETEEKGRRDTNHQRSSCFWLIDGAEALTMGFRADATHRSSSGGASTEQTQCYGIFAIID